MREIQAPNPITGPGPFLFLAGSIEMRKAIDWQSYVVQRFSEASKRAGCPWTILNPRRSDWDSTWEQSIHNDKFYQQVSWELSALEEADAILMYFDPGAKSPISLIELGLFASSGRMLVVCPDGFWRKGNVDIVCARYGVKSAMSLERAVDVILAEPR